MRISKHILFIFITLLIFNNCSNEFNKRYKIGKKHSKSTKIEDWEKSIKEFDEIINMKVNAREYQGNVYRKLARRHLELEHWNDSLKYYIKAAEIMPTEGILQHYQGICYSQLSRAVDSEEKKMDLIDKAANKYKKALELNPELSDPNYGLGIIYFYVYQDHKKGLEYMDKVLKFDNRNIDARLAYARMLYERGDSVKSLEWYKSLIGMKAFEKDHRYENVKDNIQQIYTELKGEE